MKNLSDMELWDDVDCAETQIDDFRLADGSIVKLSLAYTRSGPRNAPTYVVLHGYTGSHHALDRASRVSDAGWASAWIGPGRCLDTRTTQVITVNLPGSAYGSSWSGNEGYASVRGMAAAVDTLAEQLGIVTLDGVIGYSFGGYVAMQLKADYPERVARVLGLSTAWKGRGEVSELQALKMLSTATCRRDYREQVLLRSGLKELITMRGSAVQQRESARLDAWAQEFNTLSLWRLRAAAIEFDLGQCPPDTHLVYASSDTLFPPPEPLPANATVIPTMLGHQSLIFDPGAWQESIESWITSKT